jgi:hypothetical protein
MRTVSRRPPVVKVSRTIGISIQNTSRLIDLAKDAVQTRIFIFSEFPLEIVMFTLIDAVGKEVRNNIMETLCKQGTFESAFHLIYLERPNGGVVEGIDERITGVPNERKAVRNSRNLRFLSEVKRIALGL